MPRRALLALAILSMACGAGAGGWDTGLPVEKRTETAISLGLKGDKSARDVLKSALERDPDFGVRAEAIRAFGTLKDADAVPLIEKHTKDDSKDVRVACAWSLGQIGDPRGLPALGVLAKDAVDTVRGAAYLSIARVGGIEAAQLLADGALHDPDDKMRDAAVEHLGRMKDKTAVPVFEKALKTETDEIRAHAARAIGQLADASSIPVLAQSLEDPIPVCRGSVALAIGAIGSPDGLEPLRRAWSKEGDDLVKAAIAWAGAKLGDAPLRARLGDLLLNAEEETARAQAAIGIGDVNACEALPALKKALNDRKGMVNKAAGDALGKMKCS